MTDSREQDITNLVSYVAVDGSTAVAVVAALKAKFNALTTDLDATRQELAQSGDAMRRMAEYQEADQQTIAALKAERDEARKVLWLFHGCSVGILYGDDGEMQCNDIQKHGALDFLRQPIPELVQALLGAERARADRLEQACLDKDREIISAGELHLADESTIYHLEAKLKALEALIVDVSHAGVELVDPRISYVTVQIDEAVWQAVQQFTEAEHE
jgi:hypothetical protein